MPYCLCSAVVILLLFLRCNSQQALKTEDIVNPTCIEQTFVCSFFLSYGQLHPFPLSLYYSKTQFLIHTRAFVTRSCSLSSHYKLLGIMSALTLAYRWTLGALGTVSSWGAPSRLFVRMALSRHRELTPSHAIWKKARWCGVDSFPNVKVIKL